MVSTFLGVIIAVIQAGPALGPPGLIVRGAGITVVEKKGLGYEPAAMVVDPASTTSNTSRAGTPAHTVIVKIRRPEAYLHISNVGPKRIRRIRWVIEYFDDSERGHRTDIRRFEKKAKVGVGETRILTVATDRVAPSTYSAIAIEGVEYEDGTKWTASK